MNISYYVRILMCIPFVGILIPIGAVLWFFGLASMFAVSEYDKTKTTKQKVGYSEKRGIPIVGIVFALMIIIGLSTVIESFKPSIVILSTYLETYTYYLITICILGITSSLMLGMDKKTELKTPFYLIIIPSIILSVAATYYSFNDINELITLKTSDKNILSFITTSIVFWTVIMMPLMTSVTSISEYIFQEKEKKILMYTSLLISLLIGITSSWYLQEKVNLSAKLIQIIDEDAYKTKVLEKRIENNEDVDNGKLFNYRADKGYLYYDKSYWNKNEQEVLASKGLMNDETLIVIKPYPVDKVVATMSIVNDKGQKKEIPYVLPSPVNRKYGKVTIKFEQEGYKTVIKEVELTSKVYYEELTMEKE